MSNCIAVLDIGTDKITCMVAERVENDFIVRAVSEALYNGYDENGWYEPDSIAPTVTYAIKGAEKKLKTKIKKITVGVPTNFCYTANSEATTVFHSLKKIDRHDINDILVKADIFGESVRGKLIARNAVYYITDQGIVNHVIGKVTKKLSGLISFSFMDSVFEKSILDSLKKANIHKVNFVNSGELQGRYVSSINNANGYCIVINVGHLNTSVVLATGRGILFSKCFDLGSGYISADISQVLNISYKYALDLLPSLDLNLEFSPDDVYPLSNGLNVDAYKCNEVAKARIEQIATYIKKCFEYCDRQIPSNTPIVLTGGGLANMRGGAECLSTYLGKEVNVYKNDNPQLNKNQYTSCYALISSCLECDETEQASIFRKISGWLTRR